MDFKETVFIFDKARNRFTDEVLEREPRRKGHKLTIFFVEVGSSLVFSYLDGSGSVYTSTVRDFSFDGKELIVDTLNSVYTFKIA